MAAAKRRVFGTVGIDMIAGPSEVVILADRTGHPDWIAADLLAQAEHDAAAQSILITDDASLAARGRGRGGDPIVAGCPGGPSRSASWRDFGAIILVPDLAAALPLVDRLAPEHLEIMAADADALALRVRNAGAIFVGASYARGDRRLRRRLEPRAADGAVGALRLGARGAGLHEAHLDPQMRPGIARRRSAPAAIALGEAEGLTAHARSVAMRTNTR